MSKLPRQSKFRHVFGKEKPREQCYEGIKCSASAPDPQHIKANPKYFAVSWSGGGGALLVQKWEDQGKMTGIPPLITGHTNEVVDFDFHPFNDQLIVTASEDTTLKLWRIPDNGVTENITEAVGTLNGHRKKLVLTLFNPVANNILASVGFDQTVRIWDVEKTEEKQCLEGDHPDSIQSIDWNYTGSLFATTCRDKNIRIFDPRSGQCVEKFAGHQGSKGSRVFWCGNRDRLGSVGFSRQSDRQLAFYDPRDLSKPLSSTDVDQASGAFLPLYDNDTGLLFLAGKGETSIRYFELVDEAPWQFYVSTFSDKEAQRGACMLPKRACDVSQNEIARIVKLTTDKVVPVSFTVPRKGDQFQDDIFPDCYAGQPAVSADEWLSGKNSAPLVKSMRPGAAATARAADVAVAAGAAVTKREPAAVSSPGPVSSPKVLSPEAPSAGGGGDKDALIAKLEQENAELRARVEELSAKLVAAGVVE